MPVQNIEIASLFNELADLMEIEGENVYKIRAYRNAANAVGGFARSIAAMVGGGEDLTELPGIGRSMAEHLTEIVETGRFSRLEEIAKRVPPAVLELLKIPSIGPKRARAIRDTLAITGIDDLRRAAREGKLREIPGFGETSERKILEHLEKAGAAAPARTILADAEQLIEPLVEELRSAKGARDVVVAGSYRRRQETVGDVDIVVCAAKSREIMERFTSFEDVRDCIARGPTRSSVVLRSGLQVDLRVVPKASFGAALHYFTGSKAHNIAIRTRGVKKGLTINEYGVFRGKKRLAGATEEKVYAAVGLPYIEPELRENRGEIEAAAAGLLPRLIELSDIKGDLHIHTVATDGTATMEEIAAAARERGYAYASISDHSKRVTVARGLTAARLARQLKAIDKLNGRLRGFRLLTSIEVDILDDGSLDLPDDILEELDVVVASLHYGTNLSRDKQTRRMIRAMDNRRLTILAHPTGRILNERLPYEIDIDAVLKAAQERGVVVELNATPDRLDLNDIDCRRAKELGVKIAISTDAHRLGHLDFMRFGIGQARRAGLEAADVVNTRPLAELAKLLKRR